MHGIVLIPGVLALAMSGAVPLAVQENPSPGPAAGTPTITEGLVTSDAKTAQLLSVELLRYASDVLAVPPLSTEAIQAANLFINEAVKLDPGNVEIAHKQLLIAILTEEDDFIDRAVRHLLALTPGDQVAQLRRLVMAVDQFNIAEDRIQAYEFLLQPSNTDELGAVISSRLAFNLAMLYRQTGNRDGFARLLGESMTLDPFYAEAMAIGAGYFQTRVSDPVASIELLVSLLLSDLSDTSTPAVLANMLMQHGAYDAARRMYSLAVDDLVADRQTPSNDLLADLAVSMWASGETESALALIQVRQHELDEMFRSLTENDQPGLSPLELARLEAPMTPTLATVRAVISSGSDADTAADGMASARESYLQAINILNSNDTGDKKAQASAALELAWLQLWLGSNADEAEAHIESAQALTPLSEEARARFDGWLLLRKGFPGDALTVLEPLADADPAARLGLAVAYQEQGQLQEAARSYLLIARDTPGTLLGIWSAIRLQDMLGTRLPPTEDSAAMTALVNTIPMAVDRYPLDPRLAVSFSIRTSESDMQPYEPIMVELEIVNNTPLPMAMSPEGPIRELILLQPEIHIAGMSNIQFGPLVIDVGRRLRLEGHERVSMTIDLRATWVGRMLNIFPLSGGTVLTNGTTNFKARNNTMARNTVFYPGLLGTEVSGTPARVDGVRVNDQWVSRIVSSSGKDELRSENIIELALLASVIQDNARMDVTYPITQNILDGGIQAVLESFARMDTVQKAWFLSVVNDSKEIRSIQEHAMDDQQRLVSMILLIRLLEKSDNLLILESPVLLGASESTDLAVQSLARWVKRRAENLLERELDQDRNPPG
ncbi:MAG: hypothetical protein VX908_08115 [Planctomycetota bacterium]|nr:hypothetical protein [Planctomycetota bacterium]